MLGMPSALMAEFRQEAVRRAARPVSRTPRGGVALWLAAAIWLAWVFWPGSSG